MSRDCLPEGMMALALSLDWKNSGLLMPRGPSSLLRPSTIAYLLSLKREKVESAVTKILYLMGKIKKRTLQSTFIFTMSCHPRSAQRSCLCSHKTKSHKTYHKQTKTT